MPDRNPTVYKNKNLRKLDRNACSKARKSTSCKKNPRIPTTVHVRMAINVSELEDFLKGHEKEGKKRKVEEKRQGAGSILMSKKRRMYKADTVSLFYVLCREREVIFCIFLVSGGNLCAAGVLSSSAGVFGGLFW
jgi:hypothetical protein